MTKYRIQSTGYKMYREKNCLGRMKQQVNRVEEAKESVGVFIFVDFQVIKNNSRLLGIVLDSKVREKIFDG